MRLERADGKVIEVESEFEGIMSDFFANLFSTSGTHDMDQVLAQTPTKVTPR